MLLVSPHADDVAYSLGGHLASGRLRAERCVLLTVFGRSDFAPYARPRPGGVTETTRLRAGEDVAFARHRGLELHRMDLEEAPLREGITDMKDLFVSPAAWGAATEPNEWLERLVVELGPLVSEYATVYGPLGVGGQFDHVLVRRVLQRSLGGGAALRLYEDVPYAGEISLNEYRSYLLTLTPGLEPETLTEDGWLEEKIESLALYESQVAEKDLASVREAARRVGGERVWRER